MAGIMHADDLDKLRRELLGANAQLRFYKISPDADPALLATLPRGWHAWRNGRQDANGSTTLLLARDNSWAAARIDKTTAQAEIEAGGATRRYTVADVVETQQLTGGWKVILEPLSGAV